MPRRRRLSSKLKGPARTLDAYISRFPELGTKMTVKDMMKWYVFPYTGRTFKLKDVAVMLHPMYTQDPLSDIIEITGLLIIEHTNKSNKWIKKLGHPKRDWSSVLA